MDHRVPKIGAVISILLAVGALITFLFLNDRFQGPNPLGFLSHPYQLHASFNNTKTLPSKQPVLYKGVSVGRVNSVHYDAEAQKSVVTFTIDDEQLGPLYKNATLQIGERSLLGDAYLDLVDVGTPGSGELEAGDAVPHTLNSVDFDEALDFLDKQGRYHLHSLIHTIARGTAGPDDGEKLNGTVGGFSRTLDQLHLLTDTLNGQEQQLGKLVSDSSTVLDTLGNREQSIRTIVAAGRQTLDALASNTSSLQQGIDQLPGLLEAGRTTLAEAHPLLRSADPLVRKVGKLAPRLRPAFDQGAPFSIGPISSDLISIIKALPEQRRVSEQVLPEVTKLNELLAPVTEKSGPAALNTVPIAHYLAPRIDSFGAFYALGSSVVAHSDSVGRYARFSIIGDPLAILDQPVDGHCDTSSATIPDSWCHNAYPNPDDSLANQPFDGSYPHLHPYKPPSRQSVLP